MVLKTGQTVRLDAAWDERPESPILAVCIRQKADVDQAILR